jgi:acetylornithine/succinyldiaminopimelate/putrescine aminotransferase
VYIRVSNGLSASDLVERLAQRKVRVLAAGLDTVRAVTHYTISPKQIDQAAAAFSESVRPD